MEENTPGRKAVEQNCQTESFNQKRLLFARFHSKATAANPNKKKKITFPGTRPPTQKRPNSQFNCPAESFLLPSNY